MKGTSCLVNLIAFYNEMTTSLDMGRALNVVYFVFNESFKAVFHNICIDELSK